MAFIEVTNAVDTTENGVNQIDRYFKEKLQMKELPSHWDCAICKRPITLESEQLIHPYWTENNTMVGGHLKDRDGNLYLAPICIKCNNQRENLGFVNVNVEDLLPL